MKTPLIRHGCRTFLACFIIFSRLIANCEAVLFGSEYNAEKYKRVLFACALEDDLKQLPAGDMTQIGEKVGRIILFERKV